MHKQNVEITFKNGSTKILKLIINDKFCIPRKTEYRFIVDKIGLIRYSKKDVVKVIWK